MNQTMGPQGDPLETLVAEEIPAEKRRLKALAVSATAESTQREMASTVLQIIEDGLRHVSARLAQLYGVVGQHAEQLDSIEQQLGAETQILPEDADKILNLAEAFMVLAGELLEGRVPQIGQAGVKETLQQQIDNARDVLAIVAASAVGDDDAEEEGPEEEDQDPEGAAS